MGNGADLIIRLVTRGSWNDRIEKTNVAGFTVWGCDKTSLIRYMQILSLRLFSFACAWKIQIPYNS